MNDIDDQYRGASALDPSEPSESTRRNILAHAARLAAERAASTNPVSPDFQQPAANQASWRPAVIGTLAAACLAGLLMTPLFLPPRAPPSSESVVPAAGKAAPKPAAENAKVPSAPHPAPNAFPAPDAKMARTAPAAPPSSFLQESHSAGAPAASDSPGQEYYVPPPLAPAAPPERSVSSTSRNVASSAGAGASNAAVASAIAPHASLAAPTPAAALQQAAHAGDISALQALLATPLDINARDVHGRTALMLATLRGQAGAVDILLAHGADPNAADANGITPLQAALAGAQPSIAAALQRAGAH
jgi:hypothetical protein